MGSSEKRVVLREYQSQAVADLRKILPRHKRIVAVSPTGSGKTVIAAALIALLPKRARVVWVAHRIELLRQARAQLIAAGLPEVGILSGAYETNASARVIVASIDMLRGATVAADLVVVDEAHRVEAASYRALLDSLPRALVLGLTATPWRLDGKGLGETFASLYTVAGPTELIADGFIARPATYGVPREKARAMLRGVRSSGGDFSPAALGAAMQKKTLMGNVVKECARLAPGVPTLVFAANRDHGRALAARFANAGRPTVYLDGETPSAERAQIVDDLRAGWRPIATRP